MGTRAKRPRTSLTLEAKLDIIERLERGQTAASLGRLYNVNESSIRTIKKSAEKIRSSIAHSCSPAAKKSLRLRNPLLEKMEMMLVTWLEDQKEKKMTVNTTTIRAKALKLYKELQQEDGGPSATEPFLASKGWFEKFKKRQNLYITKLKDEGTNDIHSTTSHFSFEMKTECSLQVEQEKEEQEVITPTDKLTTKRLALFFTLADRLAQEAMDMDPNLERSLQFGRNLSSALAVYKDIYREKQRTSKQSTLSLYLKVPSSTALTPTNIPSSSITTAKLLTPQTSSFILSGTESPLQKSSSETPLLVTSNMESSHADYSPLSPSSSCSN
jgi:hypothetical protein